MRTKTLLLTAAAIVAGFVSAQADTVYSQNVVGYINVTVPPGGFSLLANQLVNGSDINKTNNDINTVLASGLVSDPAGPPFGSNSVFFVFNGSAYLPYYYFNQADGQVYGVDGSTAGWYDQAGEPSPVKLDQGTSGFLKNASASPLTVTLVGQVLQGTNSALVSSGFSLLSLKDPVSTNVVGSSLGLPTGSLSSDPNGPPFGQNDIYFYWTGTAYLPYYFFNVSDGANYGVNGSTAGFYDQAGEPIPASSFPKVGQGFVLRHFGSSFTWTNSFTVQ